MFPHHFSLVSCSENFRHLFDREMQNYLIFQNHGKEVTGGHVYYNAPLNHFMKPDTCQVHHGRWKFTSNQWDYSGRAYIAIELVRQAIVNAMKAKKKSVDVALILNKKKSELLNLVMHDQKDDHYINAERSAEREAFNLLLGMHKKEKCKCKKNIPDMIFFKFISPVLNRLLESAGFRFELITLTDVIVKQQSSPSSNRYFKDNLHAMHIEWEWKEISDREFLDAEVRRWAWPYHHVTVPKSVYKRPLVGHESL